MGILSQLKRIFSPPRPTSRYLEFEVRCSRCGEVLAGRVDLYNDPSLEFEDNKTFYICRKVLIGSSLCFQPLEATFTFDEARNVLEKRVTGGEFVD